jgi:hypothetical protein
MFGHFNKVQESSRHMRKREELQKLLQLNYQCVLVWLHTVDEADQRHILYPNYCKNKLASRHA